LWPFVLFFSVLLGFHLTAALSDALQDGGQGPSCRGKEGGLDLALSAVWLSALVGCMELLVISG